MRIVPLADAPDALPALAALYRATWAPYYGSGGAGDAEADLRKALGARGLPVCFVALEGDAVLGAATLSASSISHPHLSPWVTAHVVREDARGRGIGTRLLERVEDEARRRGFERLYLSSELGHGMLEARGWRAIDEATSLRGPVVVFSLALR